MFTKSQMTALEIVNTLDLQTNCLTICYNLKVNVTWTCVKRMTKSYDHNNGLVPGMRLGLAYLMLWIFLSSTFAHFSRLRGLLKRKMWTLFTNVTHEYLLQIIHQKRPSASLTQPKSNQSHHTTGTVLAHFFDRASLLTWLALANVNVTLLDSGLAAVTP